MEGVGGRAETVGAEREGTHPGPLQTEGGQQAEGRRGEGGRVVGGLRQGARPGAELRSA